MKAYTTEEVNEQIDKYNNTFVFDKKRLIQWMIDNGHREEDKPLNRWYKLERNQCIAFFTGERTAFGLDSIGQWVDTDSKGWGRLKDKDWKPCPEEEWKAMLINEAKKKGYKKGNHNCLFIDNSDCSNIDVNSIYVSNDGSVWCKEMDGSIGTNLFDGKTGEWAKIKVEVPEYTWEQLKEKLGHEFTIVDEPKG